MVVMVMMVVGVVVLLFPAPAHLLPKEGIRGSGGGKAAVLLLENRGRGATDRGTILRHLGQETLENL